MSSNETDTREPVADILEDRALARWEIASVFSSILIAEWILSAVAGQTKAVVAIPISLAFIFIIWSHRLRRETLREMGLRFDNFFPALKLLLVPMVVAGLLSGLVGMLAGARVDFWRWHSERPLVGQLALGFTWGLL